jgi:hypothetical protein
MQELEMQKQVCIFFVKLNFFIFSAIVEKMLREEGVKKAIA